MRSFKFLLLCVAGLAPLTARADLPVYLFDQLPVPLRLPPGNVETLPLNKTGSFYGDHFRIMDCSPDVTPAFPGDSSTDEVRFGICGNQLFGGDALFDSHLTGNLTIQFFPTSPTTAHFIVQMHTLLGDDGVLTAPLGYSFPIQQNFVSDALTLSSGDVDLTTGYANPNTLQVFASFVNTGLFAIGNANPKLSPPIVNFPGARGYAWASFVQRPDGLLDFMFRGSTFLPLGNDVGGDPFRFPLPYCTPSLNCISILARGTSFHPQLQLDTRNDLGLTPCAPNCPDIPTNKVEVFTVSTRNTAFGDDFNLDIPELYCSDPASTQFSLCALNGSAPGRSELQGRVQVQFGPQTGNTVPFVISLMPPEGLFADPPNSPILGAGFRGFLLGTNQRLVFPNATYPQHKLLFADEVFNRATGMIDLASGRVIGEFIYPMYIDQNLIEQLIPDNNGRVTLDPFLLVAQQAPHNANDPNYAFFQKGANGETVLRLNMFHKRTFASYCFPKNTYILGECYVSPPSGTGDLNIFGKIQAAHLADPADPGSAVMTDKQTFTSSIGDTFSYNFSAPCSGNGTFSFTYTNNNPGPSGGTFTMTHPVSVNCTNSAASTAPNGAYDNVAITGFGVWSKDAVAAPNVARLPNTPRFMSASISTDPANPYAAIIVFSKYAGENQKLPGALVLPGDEQDVVLSSAENKPPTKPTP